MFSGEPPAKKGKEQTTISMLVEDQFAQRSPVQRIYGYPWHLQLTKTEKDTNYCRLTLHCDMSEEAELWKCSATVTTSLVQRYEMGGSAHFARHQCRERAHTFYSWDGQSQQFALTSSFFNVGSRVDVEIATNDHGDRWNPRPMFAYAFAPRDFTLVLEGTKKIHVNSAILIEQSQFFEQLFAINKEKNAKEIPIEKLKFTDLSNVLSMIDRKDKSAYLSDDNALEVLKYARYLRIQIVEDRIVSFLLSSSSTMSNHKKLFIAESFQIPLLKDMIIARYTAGELRELSESAMNYRRLSRETTLALFKRSCAFKDHISRSPGSDSE